MNTKRLAVLADYLLTVPPEKFDIHLWSCGAAACAVGHACTIPEFNEQGLTLNLALEGTFPIFRMVNHPSYDNWEAVEYFFDLLEDDACYLFSFEGYNGTATPEIVSARIKAFIA